uniref:Transposon MuDR mudrA n=1 Tax=Solanum tuberosum TaxID=4113 RepID=M1BE55_SOLTU
MEPPEFVKLASRPKTKRVRQKDEALKRQVKNEKMFATEKVKKKQRKINLVDEGEPSQT